jgi:hypothetical protein
VRLSNNMSEDFPSSNPFRRKTGNAPTSTETNAASFDHPSPQPLPLDTSNIEPPENRRSYTKPVKRVRLQTPPPLSPEDEPVRRNDAAPQAAFDPFDNSNSDASNISDEEAEPPEPVPVRPSGAPLNPFQKTLATLERTEEVVSAAPPSNIKPAAAGRASLDVDAFKRLLMTGVSGVTGPAGHAPSSHLNHLALNDGSSTDTSSTSRHSMFEPIQETYPESPRTSHEISDDERRRARAGSQTSTSDKKKPPPPNSRHGKLITMELKDDVATPAQTRPYSSGVNTSHQRFGPLESSQSVRSITDLNKPLPAAPSRASHDSDRESIFDKESAGKTPEPPSPTVSTRRKTPPVPPITRRHSALISDAKNSRTPNGRLSPNIETGRGQPSQDLPAQSGNRPPPPPPTRRPASIRNSSHTVPLQSPTIQPSEPERPISKSSAAPPPLPPARMSSIRHSGRPPSVASMDMSGTPKRSAVAPPPPPPPRHRASSRTSIEATATMPGSSRPSEESSRRSIDSARRGSTSSQATADKDVAGVDTAPALGSEIPENLNAGANDILADITKLQQEVDALRGQYEAKTTN